jgi:hypothetical protein
MASKTIINGPMPSEGLANLPGKSKVFSTKSQPKKSKKLRKKARGKY